MKKILTMAIISLLCFSTFSMFSPSVHASITVVSARLPSARTQSASIWDGNNAYIFGGGDASGPMNQILKYNPASDSISVMSAVLPYPATDLCAVWSGQYAYIFGGAIYSPPFTRMIARYDPLTDSMTLISNTLPIYSMSAVWAGTCAYLFGGYDGYSYYDQILKYDPTNNQLTTMNAKMPIGIKWNSAVWTGNYAYIFGGNQYYDTPTDQILRYDPVADSVTVETAKLPEKVYFTSAVWAGTYAYVFGGNLDPSGATTDKIFKFDPALDECTSVVESLPSPRRGTSAIWDGQNAFIFGGDTWPPQVFLDEIVRFTPIPSTSTFSPPYDDVISGHDGSKYRKGLAYANYESSHDSLSGNAYAKSIAWAAFGGVSTAKARAWFGDDWMCQLEGTYRITSTWQWSMDAHMRAVIALVSLTNYVTIEIVDVSTNTVVGEFTKVLWEKTGSNFGWSEYHEAAETKVAVYADLVYGHTYKWIGYIGTEAGAVVIPPSFRSFIKGAGYGDISVDGTLREVNVELTQPQPPF